MRKNLSPQRRQPTRYARDLFGAHLALVLGRANAVRFGHPRQRSPEKRVSQRLRLPQQNPLLRLGQKDFPRRFVTVIFLHTVAEVRRAGQLVFGHLKITSFLLAIWMPASESNAAEIEPWSAPAASMKQFAQT